MRLRNISGSREAIARSEYVIQEDVLEQCPGAWHEIFGNKNPIHIEIGMGKGKFIHTMAKEHPHINYVGIEKYSSVLLRAVQKMTAEELPNLRFVRMDAEYIARVFAPGEVDKIYLNFSDPWPKDRHAKRRLPSREFLARYDVILSKEGSLEFKTDNRALFDFAVEQLKPAGWHAEYITYDLHGDRELSQGNVMTEYEQKFSAKGNPIYKYKIVRNKCGAAASAEMEEIMEYKFTEANFEEEVLHADLPVLVDFYADWCGPCKMMGPVVEQMAEEFEGKMKVGKCNTDENMLLAQKYRVSSIPCFIIFKNGAPAATFVGAMSADEMSEKLEQELA